MRRILNVAEKPSAAKEITRVLSKGASRIVHSRSKFNPIYEFQYDFNGEQVIMSFTSVTGHIMQLDFEEQYGKKFWSKVPPEALFRTAKINKFVDPEKESLAQNLIMVSKNSQGLILWLDCDREGEAIAFEVLEICQGANPRLQIFRAQFSAFTKRDIETAMLTLRQPDENLAAAVESRQEIDLRIGSAFTRFQTNLLQKKLPTLSSQVISSYGPCQFPTLGFVVERYKKVINFIPEDFWFLSCKHERLYRLNKNDGKKVIVDFLWDRKHFFYREAAVILYEKCMERLEATVIDVAGNQKSRWRPVPLSTVNMQKLATSKLRLSSHRVMEIAEKLYNRGLVSYPRTETDSFSQNINVKGLIEYQRQHPIWGNYATQLLDNNKFQWPRKGGHDDKAHPPIHPVKMVTQNEGLTYDEWKVYELITRHFLACCSQDARGFETVVRIEIQNEYFHAKGLMIREYNWLEIYPYEKWTEGTLPEYNKGEKFRPFKFEFKESTTSPPKLLSENELITLMDKNGIGTDATIHEHIKTIQERNYAKKIQAGLIEPTKLGIALVEAYEKMGIDLWKPFLRAAMEANMTQISRGSMAKETFLDGCLTEIQELFQLMKSKEAVIIEVMRQYFTNIEPEGVSGGETDFSNYNLLNDQEGNCGNCGNRSLKIYGDQRGGRIARCELDDMVFKLPAKSEYNFEEKLCPLCSFQVIEVKNENNTRYNICPMCYSNPPEALFEDAAEQVSMSSMPCFKCPNTDCSFAKGMSNKPVFRCPKCNQAGMAFKKNKLSKIFLGCQGYPKCNHIISVPECIKEAKVLTEVCQKCQASKVGLKFTNDDILPPQIRIRLDENENAFCFTLGCDFDIESLRNNHGSSNTTFLNQRATQIANNNQPQNQIQNKNIGSVQSAIQRFNTKPGIQIGYETQNATPIRGNSAQSQISSNIKSQTNMVGVIQNTLNTKTTRDNFETSVSPTPQYQRPQEIPKSGGNIVQTYTSMTNMANQINATLSSKESEISKDLTSVKCRKCQRNGHYIQNCPGFFTKENISKQAPTNQIHSNQGSSISNVAPICKEEKIQSKKNLQQQPVPSKASEPKFQNSRSYLGGSTNSGFSGYPDENHKDDDFEDYLNNETKPFPQRNNFNPKNTSYSNEHTENGPKKKGACFKCGQEGHWAPNCPNGGTVQSNQLRQFDNPNKHTGENKFESSGGKKGACFKCGQEGHWAPSCPNQSTAGNFQRGGGTSSSFQNKSFSNRNDSQQKNEFVAGNSKVTCYKCQQPGHYASNCSNNGENFGTNSFGGAARKKRDEFEEGGTDGGKKSCNLCGHIGRHPKGSSCPSVKRKQMKKNQGEYRDYGGKNVEEDYFEQEMNKL